MEARLLNEADLLLMRIKQECSPEFAARCEEYMHRNKLLPSRSRTVS